MIFARDLTCYGKCNDITGSDENGNHLHHNRAEFDTLYFGMQLINIVSI